MAYDGSASILLNRCFMDATLCHWPMGIRLNHVIAIIFVLLQDSVLKARISHETTEWLLVFNLIKTLKVLISLFLRVECSTVGLTQFSGNAFTKVV